MDKGKKKVNKKVPSSEKDLAQPVAEKKKKRKAVAEFSEDIAIPIDLRGGKRKGRPSNAERISAKYFDDQLALLASDLLMNLRKNCKKISYEQQGNLLCKILPHLTRSESEEDSKMMSLEIMGKRYLEMKIKIHEAEEASRAAATKSLKKS